MDTLSLTSLLRRLPLREPVPSESSYLNGHLARWDWNRKDDILHLQLTCTAEDFNSQTESILSEIEELNHKTLIRKRYSASDDIDLFLSNYTIKPRWREWMMEELNEGKPPTYSLDEYVFRWRDGWMFRPRNFSISVFYTNKHGKGNYFTNGIYEMTDFELKIQGFTRLVSLYIQNTASESISYHTWNHSPWVRTRILFSIIALVVGVIGLFNSGLGIIKLILGYADVDNVAMAWSLRVGLLGVISFFVAGGTLNRNPGLNRPLIGNRHLLPSEVRSLNEEVGGR